MGSIRHEIKQRRPFRSPADEALVTLLRTADHLRAALSSVVEPHGITVQQYNVLRILRGAGQEGLPTLDIAQRMIEHSPGITRLLERLEAKELVRRQRCAEDRRQVLCFATDHALALLEALDAPLQQETTRLFAALAGRRTTDLVQSLDALRGGSAGDAASSVAEANASRRKAKEKRKP